MSYHEEQGSKDIDLRPTHLLFGCTSRTVSYARELISVFMCCTQWVGFDTYLYRLGHYNCTVLIISERVIEREYKRPCLLGVVMFGGTIMCYPGRR